MKSRERVIHALELEEPDIVPTFEMIISPPKVVEQILNRKSVYNNIEYLLELRLKNLINPADKKDIENINRMYVEDIYEVYKRLDLDMIRFSPHEIHIPKNVRKIDKKTWEIDGVQYRYDSYSLWLTDPRMSFFKKGSEYVLNHIRSIRNETISKIREYSFTNLKMLLKINRDEKFILADAGGIWGNVVSDPYGVIEVLKWLILKPSVVRELFSFYTDVVVERAKVLLEEGADGILICEDYGMHGKSWMSPRQFREFILPNLRRISATVVNKGGFFIIHTDGNVMPILDLLAISGAHAYQSIDKFSGMNLAEVKEKVGEKLCLIGNVDLNILAKGTVDDVKAEVKRCMNDAACGGGYIISSSGSMVESTLENLLTYIRYARKIGKYPQCS